MKMFRNLTVALIALMFSMAAVAEFNFSVNYVRAEIGPVELDTFQANLGYGFEVSDGFFLIPEIRAGISASGDNLVGNKITMDSTFGGGLRAEYNFSSGFMVFGGPSYNRYKIEVSSPTFGTESFSSWEFGIGAGVGYNFVDNFGVEAFYENVDSEDFYGAGLRFRF